MIKYLLFLLVIFHYSCVSTRELYDISGVFIKEGKDFRDILRLKNDNTFILEEHSFDVHKKCQGKATIIKPNKILLRCNDEAFPAALGNSYMQDREREVIVLSKKKIKLGNVVLKRSRDK
jgi:hypothetical protein